MITGSPAGIQAELRRAFPEYEWVVLEGHEGSGTDFHVAGRLTVGVPATEERELAIRRLLDEVRTAGTRYSLILDSGRPVTLPDLSGLDPSDVHRFDQTDHEFQVRGR